jgi:PiT family inorganic phosphate transporter
VEIHRLEDQAGHIRRGALARLFRFASLLGAPVPTTHTITGAVIGVGAATRFSAIRWGVAYKIVWTWVLTIPGTALVSFLLWEAAGLLGFAT